MGQREITPFEASMKRKKGISAVAVCRLDVESAVVKKEVEPDGGDGALSSSRYTLGRGVKRKQSLCEDLAQDLPYPQQRQLVLDLCLDKLQSCQQRAEPSLHRSVLLANTLRQIQQEMRQEGETCLPPAPLGSSLTHASTPHHFSDLPPIPLACPPPVTGALSPSFPLTTTSEDVQLGGAENETLLPSFAGEEDARSPDSLFGSFEITNSTSYLTDLALDDIFEDIDTSMYDSSDISVLAFPAQKSRGADDGLKNVSCCTSNGSLQLCLSDLNDLDHIMEILVRS